MSAANPHPTAIRQAARVYLIALERIARVNAEIEIRGLRVSDLPTEWQKWVEATGECWVWTGGRARDGGAVVTRADGRSAHPRQFIDEFFGEHLPDDSRRRDCSEPLCVFHPMRRCPPPPEICPQFAHNPGGVKQLERVLPSPNLTVSLGQWTRPRVAAGSVRFRVPPGALSEVRPSRRARPRMSGSAASTP